MTWWIPCYSEAEAAKRVFIMPLREERAWAYARVAPRLLMVLFGTVGGAMAMEAVAATTRTHDAPEGTDPYLWLEDVHGEKSMDWVRTQNAHSMAVLRVDPDYQKDYQAILKVMDAVDRTQNAGFSEFETYGYWLSAKHPERFTSRMGANHETNVKRLWLRWWINPKAQRAGFTSVSYHQFNAEKKPRKLLGQLLGR